jgi:acyl-CoA hydrolase
MVESRYLLMPDQANPYGTAFGGVIMAWIDMVASMAVQRHCGSQVVTASIESMSFIEPIRIGEHVHLRAMVVYVGRTSMEVEVQVMHENPQKRILGLATTAHLTFVAIDENQHPIPVAPIVPQTEHEQIRFAEAEQRHRTRRSSSSH